MVLGAEATGVEATAATAIEALSLANGCAVEVDEASALESVIQRLASPCLHLHPAHLRFSDWSPDVN